MAMTPDALPTTTGSVSQGHVDQRCVYCGRPTGTRYDEHPDCVERSLVVADLETDAAGQQGYDELVRADALIGGHRCKGLMQGGRHAN